LLVRLGRVLGQVRRALTSRWLVSLAGALSGCLLLWFLGPLLSLGGVRPLESDEPRLAGVLGLMIAWGLFNQMQQVREGRANRRLIRALISTTKGGILSLPAPNAPLRLSRQLLADPIPAASGEIDGLGGAEVEGLQHRLAEALATYGRRLGTASLRRLPWYLVIGAPGAGKTTAIAQSGLTFPLSDLLGHQPIQGVAGTRTCDWWFTSEAVLVDTAGRYTTQDSEQAADSAAWLGLLTLLKRHRPAQPINGLVVTVSLADLANQDAQERQVIAESLSQRLGEIDDRLGLRLPVYLLLTKADRLAGFLEFFADLSAGDRRQVWGITFPLAADSTGAGVPFATLAGRFTHHFESLIARLEHRMLERLAQEPDPVRRALIAGFPQQVTAMRAPLTEFLARAFPPSGQSSAHQHPPAPQRRLILRGVYLSSAKREGPPIDTLAAEMLSTFGLDHPLPQPDRRPDDDFNGDDNNGFFLRRLFGDVVFAEAHLAGDGLPGASTGLFRRRRWVALAALTASLVLAGLWGQAWLAGHWRLATLEADLDAAARLLPDDLAGGPRVDRVADGDVASVLPVLNVLDALRTTAATDSGPAPWAMGLNRGDRLSRLTDAVLHRALRRLLLPRLVVRLEQVLAGSAVTGPPSPDHLYDTLKVTLMLTGHAPLDRYLVTQWFTLDWIATLPGPEHEGDRRRLADHLATLLEADWSVGLDAAAAPAVAGAQRRLAGYPLAGRGAALVRAAPELGALPGWHLPDHAGAVASQVLSRRSGRALSEPIPGLYTREACLRTVLPVIAQVAADLAQDGWVLGLPVDAATTAARAGQLRQDLAARYFDDYARQWQALLDDLTLAPTGTLPELLPVLAAAAGPESPLPALTTAIAAETDLPPPSPAPPKEAGPTTARMLGLPSDTTVVTTIQSSAGGADPGWWGPAAADLRRHFAAVRALTQPGADGGPPAMTAAVAALGDLQHALAHWAGIAGTEPGAGDDVQRAADRVKTLATTMPAPIAGWFAGFGEAADHVLLLGPGGAP
jgi:type VI secretion system protein ImpL